MSGWGTSGDVGWSVPRDDLPTPTPLGIQIFESDPGLPVQHIPAVELKDAEAPPPSASPAPPVSPVPISGSGNSAERAFTLQELEQLRHAPGTPGSGTRIWKSAPRLIGVGSFEVKSSTRRSSCDSICDVQYLCINGTPVHTIVPTGFENENTRYPRVIGACSRSIGVATDLRTFDIVDNSPRGSSRRRSTYYKSRSKY
jgi:hypothetical protein